MPLPTCVNYTYIGANAWCQMGVLTFEGSAKLGNKPEGSKTCEEFDHKRPIDL